MAQDRLIEGPRELGTEGRFGQDLGPAPDIAGWPLIGGGRYLVKGGDAVDLRTGSVVPLGAGTPVAFDAARPRVFVARADGIWLVDLQAARVSPFSPGPTTDLVSCLHAPSADVLLCVRFRTAVEHDLLRIHSTGRHVLLTTRFSFGVNLVPWIVTADAKRVYFVHCARYVGGPNCIEDLGMFDLTSGVLMTTNPPAGGFGTIGTMFWDALNERLFMSFNGSVWIMNRDLQLLGSAYVGGRCHQFAISPHTGRLYVNRMDYYYSPAWSTLSAFDSSSYQQLAPEVTRSAGESCGPLRVLTAPGAPRDVHATVTGNTVALSWTNVGDASQFVLEAGLIPGRTDLSVTLGADARTTFENVPSGTYYLRLRGGNAFGGGRPSSEFRVVVP